MRYGELQSCKPVNARFQLQENAGDDRSKGAANRGICLVLSFFLHESF